MSSNQKMIITKLFHKMSIAVPENMDSFDSMLPLLELVKADKSVFIFKVDGERSMAKEEKVFTAIISTTTRPTTSVRLDSNDMFEAIRHVLIEYAQQHWNFTV